MDPDFSTIDNRTDMAVTTNIKLNFDSFHVKKSGPLRLLEVYQTNRPMWTEVFEYDDCGQRHVSTYLARLFGLFLQKSLSETENHVKKRGHQFNYNDFDTQPARVR